MISFTKNQIPLSIVKWFRVEARGKFYVAKEGIYTFYVGADYYDDGSRLTVDGSKIVRTGTKFLEVGWHDAFGEMNQTQGDYGLKIEYSGPGLEK